MAEARRWRSLTPFVANVYLKPPRRGPEWALRQEIIKRSERRLPELLAVDEIEGYPNVFETRRRIGTTRESRSRHPGAFFRLEFAEPVQGPLAFGFACHLGLGLFRHDDPGEP
jgi:CRISPR-associated protein Csb2